MRLKHFNKLVEDLERVRARWNSLRRHYVTFCARAAQVADPQSGAKEIKARLIGDDLYVDYLNVRLRTSFEFDAKAGRGFLCADDISTSEMPDGERRRIATIRFDGGAETDLLTVSGDPVFLSDPSNAIVLVLSLIEMAVRKETMPAPEANA